MDELDSLKRSSRRSAIISLTGIAIFIFSLIYSAYSLNKANERLKQVKNDVDSLNGKLLDLRSDEVKLNEYIIGLVSKTESNSNYKYTEDIDWDAVKKTLIQLPAGNRKLAVSIALLTTWKDIPFKMGTRSTSLGFDSPRFIEYILNQVGIEIKKPDSVRLSAAMIQKFKKVDKPLPGDLIFYKGQVGNFGLIYLCEGDPAGQGVAIGTLESSSPLAIYETKYINTPVYPFLGYYRVEY